MKSKGKREKNEKCIYRNHADWHHRFISRQQQFHRMVIMGGSMVHCNLHLRLQTGGNEMMTQFEQHVDWFVEHLKGLGYAKVTLCKDCKKYSRESLEQGRFCMRYYLPMKETDYCSRAEKL